MIVDYALLFNCTTADRASDLLTARPDINLFTSGLVLNHTFWSVPPWLIYLFAFALAFSMLLVLSPHHIFAAMVYILSVLSVAIHCLI